MFEASVLIRGSNSILYSSQECLTSGSPTSANGQLLSLDYSRENAYVYSEYSLLCWFETTARRRALHCATDTSLSFPILPPIKSHDLNCVHTHVITFFLQTRTTKENRSTTPVVDAVATNSPLVSSSPRNYLIISQSTERP